MIPLNGRRASHVAIVLVALLVVGMGTFLFAAHLPSSLVRSVATQSHRRHLQSTSGFETRKLLEKFQIARAKYMEKLAVDYGAENINLLFRTNQTDAEGNTHTAGVGRVIFGTGDEELNWSRVTRKVMIKILRAQVEGKPQSFVWATGGHSASAGHGNFHNESYTAYMERGSSEIFQAAGLELTARNYGMGGMPSGMQIAACMKEVFGMDADAVSWDYGMTTAGRINKVEYWFYRAAFMPNRPSMMCISCSMRMIGRVGNILEAMQERGSPMFDMDHDVVEKKMPDTDGLTQEQIDAMPKFIRSYRCGTKFEIGDPTCGEEKFTKFPNDSCNERPGRVSWHPGWKAHALKGNLLTLFWMEILDDALKAILEKGSDPRVLLDSLVASENADYEKLLSMDLPPHIDEHLNETVDIPNDVIYKKPNFCHIAQLPAQIRYQGILTESDIKDPFSHRNYDKGVELKTVLDSSAEGRLMPVVRDQSLYARGENLCKNHEIDIDYKDFFFANSEGWSKLVLPNPTEKSVYSTDEPIQGYIAMCLAMCGWSCPKGTLTFTDFYAGNASMTVNGVTVQNITSFGDDRDDKTCHFLRHSGGHKWQPNDGGQFEISARSHGKGNYIRFSAFVIW